MTYIIGSFNLRKLATTDKKNLNIISEIIRNERMDVVALQEIFREEAVDSLMKALGPLGWDFSWEAPKNNDSSNANEGYAFIWNKRKLSKVKSTDSQGNVRPFEPRIVNQYKRFGHTELMRPPYYGRFTPSDCPGGNQMELRLLNVHLRFSGIEDDLNSYFARKNEFHILTSGLLPKIQDKVYGTNYNTYTLILGDYNLNIDNKLNNGPYLDHIVELKRNGQTQYIHTVQDQKTTLKKDQTISYEMMDDHFANNYDHFTYDNVLNGKCDILQCRRVEGQKYTGDNFEKYQSEVSDHFPIIMEIDIRGGNYEYR